MASDLDGTVAALTRAALGDDAEACWCLAFLHAFGRGVLRDETKTRAVLQQAASLGLQPAGAAAKATPLPEFTPLGRQCDGAAAVRDRLPALSRNERLRAHRRLPTMRRPPDAPVSSSTIKKVWIEAGCISCKLCQDIAPKVFLVDDDKDCVVKLDAAAHFATLREDIEQAVRDCPVEVIKFEHGG